MAQCLLLAMALTVWWGVAQLVRPEPAAGAAPAAPQRATPAPPVTPRQTPAPPVPPAVPVTREDIDDLRDRDLLIPVAGVPPKALRSTYYEKRGSTRAHEALDILAPRGTAVLAVEKGTIAKFFNSQRGGLTIYQFDDDDEFAYYYAHLDRYAADLDEGEKVKRGQVIGYVGTSGNAPPNTPHLHFAIFKLGPERRWWQGAPIDPYLVLQ
jgi:peptidoglycan LD-endopeptidase LytH